jgi:hypothetical protein
MHIRNTMKNNTNRSKEKKTCKLLKEDISFRICSEIKILHTGFYREDLLETIKGETGMNESEIMQTCKSCPYFHDLHWDDDSSPPPQK